MSVCQSNIYHIIQTYIKQGWNELTDIFNSNVFAKEKELKDPNVNENLLKMLGSIRMYIVNEMYECSKSQGQFMIKDGSDNITSDYDLTIIGPGADETMIRMFNKFLQLYKTTLPQSFDTNIYVHAYFIDEGRFDDNEKRSFTIKERTEKLFVPKYNNNDTKTYLTFACIKLLETEQNFDKFNILNSYINKSRKKDTKLKGIYNKRFGEYKKNSNYDDKTLELIVKYQLSCEYGEKLGNLIYNSDNKNLQYYAMFYSTMKYFSIEPVYTPSTFNVVVLKIIRNINIVIDKHEHICSIIENLGDFVYHFNKEFSSKPNENIKPKIIKYSKYLYRIYYSLKELYPNESIYSEMTTNLKEKIINNRGTPELITDEQINDLLFYDLKDPEYMNDNYVNTIIDEFCQIIENTLNNTSFKII